MFRDRVSHPPDTERPADLRPLMLRMPIDVRSTSLGVLALLAVIGFLSFAQAVFIPITVAVLTSYALTPVVDWMNRRGRVPKTVGAALTLALILGAIGFGLNSLQPKAVQILDIVPLATSKFSQAVRSAVKPRGTVERIEKAATEIEKAANAAATTGVTPAPPAAASSNASPNGSAFRLRDYVVMGTASAIAGIGQLVVIVALAYLLLIAGDSFRRTLVRITGDTLSDKKITVKMLDEINFQIRRYLLVQLAMSVLLGMATWITFVWIGLNNALFWACVAGILHLIPYVGPTALVFIIALVAYVQFDSLQPVVVLIVSTLVFVGAIGLLLVPWLTQRLGQLNAVTVFITLLFWGWLWGIWGLLLGVPIVMAFSAVCGRVDDLRAISELLGYAPEKRRKNGVGAEAQAS